MKYAAAKPMPEPGMVRCGKCRGTGVWYVLSGMYAGKDSRCSQCGGVGWMHPSESTQAKLERQRIANAPAQAAWRAANPAAAAWIDANKETNTFASAMAMNLDSFGTLTAPMLGAITRNLDRAAQALKPPAALSIDAIAGSFAKAKAQGIKWPKMNLGRFTFSLAGDNSRNPGAVYVNTAKDAGGIYLGKIANSLFTRSRDCDSATEAAIIEAATDPKAAAIAYGKKFGRCAICSRELSDPASVELGIGPICAGRMGW